MGRSWVRWLPAKRASRAARKRSSNGPDYGRYVVFQLAGVAVLRASFAAILRCLDRLRGQPVPAIGSYVSKDDEQHKAARERRRRQFL